MNRTKGIFFGILAAFIYGFTPILGKMSYMEGSNSLSLTFYRNFLSIPLLFFMLKFNNIPVKINKIETKKLAVLSSLGPTLTALTLYGSFNYISVGMSTTIHYIYPVLVTAACIMIFKEKVSKEIIVALILSTIGVMMFLEGNFSLLGVFLSFVSGVIFAAHLIYIDKSGLNSMYPFKITFYLSIFSSVYLFLFGILSRTLVFDITPVGWLFTLSVAFFASFLANSFILIGVKHAGPTITSIVGMFEPITSIILGIIFLKEPLTVRNIIACILILAGVLIVSIVKDKKNDTEINIE
ncbi:DMT family transporter [Sedimentibacter sp.]|uniref:DMT family transporter n=1 Tax=Sedimentibacter sp. TaxID=1960295 RepID=UPI000EBE83C2|nr:DMT family transporter [Sedimentibacter sp.]HCX61238.1 EamA family transporter [Clostridiales bacterium]